MECVQTNEIANLNDLIVVNRNTDWSRADLLQWYVSAIDQSWLILNPQYKDLIHTKLTLTGSAVHLTEHSGTSQQIHRTQRLINTDCHWMFSNSVCRKKLVQFARISVSPLVLTYLKHRFTLISIMIICLFIPQKTTTKNPYIFNQICFTLIWLYLGFFR